MMRSRRGVLHIVALVGVAAFAAAPAAAKVKRHHAAHPLHAREAPRVESFPTYVDRGVDRNPGGDDLYFNDTKNPNYIVGPAWFQRWE